MVGVSTKALVDSAKHLHIDWTMFLEHREGVFFLVIKCYVCADVLHDVDLLRCARGGYNFDMRVEDFGVFDDESVFLIKQVIEYFAKLTYVPTGPAPPETNMTFAWGYV